MIYKLGNKSAEAPKKTKDGKNHKVLNIGDK